MRKLIDMGRRSVLISRAIIVTATIGLSWGAAAQAQSDTAALSTLAAVSLCEELHSDFTTTSAELTADGWTDFGKASDNAFWDEPGALALRNGEQVLFFVGKDTTIGAADEEFGGTCQIAMPGNSIVAATQIAAFLDTSASGYRSTGTDIVHSVAFRRGDTLYEVASFDEEFTNMRIQVGKRVSEEQ